jgi:hypothetical protein
VSRLAILPFAFFLARTEPASGSMPRKSAELMRAGRAQVGWPVEEALVVGAGGGDAACGLAVPPPSATGR